MDSTMSLMEADYSLFGGDLLFPPPSVSNDEVLTELQDGLKAIPEYDQTKGHQIEQSLSQEVLSNEAISGDLQQDWLDTSVDLLSLFCSENKLATETTPFDIPDKTEDANTDDAPGLEALKSLTEQIALELSTEAEAPRVSADDTDLSGQNTGDVYDTGLGLLELLTGTVNETIDVSGITDLDLLPIDTSSPILSPVSPEDVETILSSGPTSPVSCTTEEGSFESYISPDHALIDFSTMETDESLSEDLVELVQMVQLPAPTEAAAGGKARVKKSRSTPYERNKKPSQRQSEQPDVDPKITDRKMRKKQQNKDAATRYRQKKKMEQNAVGKDLDVLESRNDFLKDKVDQMTKEIQYLKNLLIDVHKAKIRREKSE